MKRGQRVHDLLQRKIADLDTRLAELQEFRRTPQGYFEECERTLAKGDREACPVRRYNQAVDAATTQLLAGTKTTLTPERYVTLQEWFDKGVNELLNQLLLGSQH